MKKYDAIVIGAGIGGLTVASLLANRGWKILLLEKENRAGGYVVSFQKDRWTFDATGSFVGGCQEGGAFYQILKEIGADKEIEFIPIHHIRNIYPGFEITLHPGGFTSYSEALFSLFPEEEKGLRSYLSLIQKIGDEVESYSGIGTLKKILFPFYFSNLLRFYRSSHGAVLNRLFKGEEIKVALHTLPVTDPPSRLSFLLVATVVRKALMEGVFYPKGGMAKIPEAFANAFLRSGGEIRLRKEVERILVKDVAVEGVETKNGEIFEAPVVLSNVNPNLLAKMVPSELQKPFLRELKRLEYSLSSFILYIATEMDLEKRGLPYFTYLRSIMDLEEEDRMLRRGEIPKNPTLMISIPTLLDSSLAPAGHHLIKVLAIVPYDYQERWGAGDPEKYRQIKAEFSERILQQLESRFIPGLRQSLLFHDAATPLTLERYTGNERGAMYGLASTPQQIGNSRPSHRTSIPGLFQVGHYTRPAHGIVGASFSGLFCARAILKGKF